MYLKKIQLQGFKSFSDKTIIEFKNGITGIVGPNGSGKSNVSDAIRWALGEQSTKTLRSNKMEDVIFAGSETKKPLGFAEVILTFDNTDNRIPLDYSEVAVKRKVYRSGESEYSINNSQCRLKDIRELFLDTGIGKDGYSIIGQGKIDEILSNKPEERRFIFEEAAGIMKFKTRKEEAERKLSRTEENVIRINDILSELDKRHDYLKDESEKAIKYNEITENLNSYEWDLIIRKIEKVKIAIEELKKSEKEIINNKDGIQSKIEELRKNINQNEELLNEINIELNKTDEIYNKNSEELLKYNNERTILEESKRYSLLENDRLKRDIELKELKIKDNTIENKRELEKNLELREKLESARKNYEKQGVLLNEKIELLLKDELELESEKDNLISFYNKITDKKGELNNSENNIHRVLNQLNETKIELENIELEINNTKIELEKIVLDNNLEKEKEAIYKTQYNDLKKNEEILIKDIETNKSIVEKNNIDLNLNQSKYNLNKNMQDSYDGYYRSVKAIMLRYKKDISLKEHILGVVADLIEVKNEHSKAIDIALGSNVQNIVTKDENSGKLLIDYLKKNNLGRATFLPLNIIKGRTLDLKGIDYNEYGIIGLGSEIIKYDEKYKNIMENLLGRVVITKNMDYSIKLSKRLNYTVRIVTLDGDIINPGGSMTGGSSNNKGNNLISRKNTLKELEEEREKLLASNEKITDYLKIKLEEYNKSKTDILEIEEKIKENNFKLFKYNNEIENKNNEINRLSERNIKLKESYDILNKDNIELEDVKSQLSLEIETMEKENKGFKDKIENLTENLKYSRMDKDKLSDELTQLKIQYSSLEEELKYNEEKTIKIIEENKSLENDIDFDKKTIIENSEESIELQEKIEKLTKSIDAIVSQNKILQEEKLIAQNKRDDINIGLKKYKDEEIESYKIMEEINQGNSSIQQNITRNNVYYENYLEEFKNKFYIDYRDNMEEKHSDISYDKLNRMINGIKKEIDLLGVVNLGSIEEYEEVKERFDFMTKQVEDLNKAKNDLLKIIKDMEANMKVKFLESFETIKKNFNEVFQILFNGGKAELLIEDEKDILNSGIEIKAQPPGKKFQSLSLLSGGERSLTAVALLFSILEIKPAPFCILDEIDAALDESNIDRYTNYLTKFSNETQFIMITHRKRTMEIADMIYGVTMEEEGSSKTISIELSDIQDENE